MCELKDAELVVVVISVTEVFLPLSQLFIITTYSLFTIIENNNITVLSPNILNFELHVEEI
jgi:hypothetical protein